MNILVIIICLLLCAFFSGMEIAYVSSNKIYLEIEKKQDTFLSRILTTITEKPSKFIATMLVGNNISLVVYGFFMGDLITQHIFSMGYHFDNITNVLIQSVISTLIVLITSEFLPKVFFQIYANSVMKFFAIPSYVFYTLFNFISSFIIWISDFLLKKFFKTEGDYVPSYFSKVELGNYISQQMNAKGENEAVDSEIQIFQNALEFSGVKARDIMTPRTELVAIEVYDSVTNLRELFVQTGYSKIIVFQNTLDDILGYVHSFELFKKPRTLKSVMIPVEFVPETIFIKDVLNLLTKKRKSVAVVLDEYGGTSGIITVEDIIEELFGEIEDEHDNDGAEIEVQLAEGQYRFSARLEVAYINETYKLNLPENDSYSTLGGLIVDHSEEIPQKGDSLQIAGYQFQIEAASNRKIEVVLMAVLLDE
ncbi:hemolysin family protein [Flavobacterium sp.]|jgi:putative hemolysin|uniref:hemolysin family protein n=1 Tax=Flavobacterium sp. TaxID=239 RepID=UPI00261E69DA|nr:hemolysin family protein [Flavobacterium sp.]